MQKRKVEGRVGGRRDKDRAATLLVLKVEERRLRKGVKDGSGFFPGAPRKACSPVDTLILGLLTSKTIRE